MTGQNHSWILYEIAVFDGMVLRLNEQLYSKIWHGEVCLSDQTGKIINPRA